MAFGDMILAEYAHVLIQKSVWVIVVIRMVKYQEIHAHTYMNEKLRFRPFCHVQQN